MDKETTVNTNQSAVTDTVVSPTTPITTDDAEARFAQLESDIARAIEERSNNELGFLKEKNKNKQEAPIDEDDDDRIRRISADVLANSRLVEIAREQDELIKRTLKENKELKLAQLNKTTTPPASIGTHSESQTVQDPILTPEQIGAFKALNWSDKDIEKFKINWKKNGGR